MVNIFVIQVLFFSLSSFLFGATRSGKVYNPHERHHYYQERFREDFFCTTRSGRIHGKLAIEDELEIVYMPATEDDFEELCNIYHRLETLRDSYYKRYSPDKRQTIPDGEKLAIHPEREVLLRAIQNRHIFVAKSLISRKTHILGFIKLFLADQEETRRILTSELCALGKAPIAHGRYKLKQTNIYTFENEPNYNFESDLRYKGLEDNQRNGLRRTYSGDNSETLLRRIPSYGTMQNLRNVVSSPRAAEPENLFTYSQATTTALYYGGAYTKRTINGRELRHHGINTKLQVYALKYIFRNILTDVLKNESTMLMFLFGQIQANSGSLNSVRIFIEFLGTLRTALALNINPTNKWQLRTRAFFKKLEELREQEFRVLYYGFKAYKPVFYYDESNKWYVKRPCFFNMEDPHEEWLKKNTKGVGKVLIGSLQPRGTEYIEPN